VYTIFLNDSGLPSVAGPGVTALCYSTLLTGLAKMTSDFVRTLIIRQSKAL